MVDYAKVLNEGLNKIIKDAEEELRNLRFMSADAVKKADFLKSVIISLTAIVRIAKRFGDLAAKMASKEKDANTKERAGEDSGNLPLGAGQSGQDLL